MTSSWVLAYFLLLWLHCKLLWVHMILPLSPNAGGVLSLPSSACLSVYLSVRPPVSMTRPVRAITLKIFFKYFWDLAGHSLGENIDVVGVTHLRSIYYLAPYTDWGGQWVFRRLKSLFYKFTLSYFRDNWDGNLLRHGNGRELGHC